MRQPCAPALGQGFVAALLAALAVGCAGAPATKQAAPPPERGAPLEVTSDPEGALVLVDGAAVGLTPLLEHVLTPGAHEVELRLDDHRRHVQHIEARPDQGVALHGRLARREGELEIEAVDAAGAPVEAEVRIDGVAAGPLPYSERILLGPHEVEVEGRAGRAVRIVRVPEAGTERVKLTLSPTAAESCELQPAHFAFDSSELSPHAKGRLRRNLRCLRERGARRVRVEGHAARMGLGDYEQELSERIAAACASFVAITSPELKLERSARASTRPLCTLQTQACYWLNNRCELVPLHDE